MIMIFPPCSDTFLIFQNNFNRLSEESCSKTKRSKFNSSPYITIVIVLALKVNGKFLLYVVALDQKLVTSKHIIETFVVPAGYRDFRKLNSLISKSILNTTCSGIKN